MNSRASLPSSSLLRAVLRWGVCLALVGSLTTGSVAADEDPLPFGDLIGGIVEASTFNVVAANTEDAVLFWANDGRRGRELWITDGSVEGTRLWTEVCPGECRNEEEFRSFSDQVAFDGQRAFFAFDDGIHGYELWTADGSSEGTKLVADICPGACDAVIRNLALIGDQVFFALLTPELGIEPWVSDGTAEGTRSLGDLRPGSLNSFSRDFLPFGDGVAFQAMTDTHGTEWWETDGTPEGTRRLTDLCPGQCSTFVTEILEFDEAILFSSNVDGAGETLYRLAPGEQPVALADMCVGSSCRAAGPLQESAGLAYFTRSSRLWSTDGTVQGTGIVLELPEQIVAVKSVARLPDGPLLVLAKQEPYDGSLWAFDGGELVGPLLVVKPDASLVVLGDQGVLIDANIDGIDLWRSDGTVAGTVVYDHLPVDGQFSSFAHVPVVLGDQVIFGGRYRSDFRLSELLASRGQSGDVRPLLGVEDRPSGGRPSNLAAAGSRVVFRADIDDRTFDDLWAADDTGGLVRLLQAAEPTGMVEVPMAVGPRVFFNGYGESGPEFPWLTDGTIDGTFLLASLDQPELYKSREPVAFDGDLVFLADQGRGQKIWRSDGTPGGAELVIDLRPDWLNIHEGCGICSPPIIAGPIFPRELRVVGGEGASRLVFVGGQEDTGAELWVSDGTVEGTALLLDLVPGEGGSEPENLIPAGEGLVYTAATDAGRFWWLWNGQGNFVRYVEAGEVVGSTSWGDQAVWIEQRDGRFVIQVSDGTLPGTREIATLPLGTVPGNELAASANRLFFVASDSLGAELWVSHLLPSGAAPRRVADLWPGVRGSFPEYLRNFDGQLYFSADDEVHGRELWRLDTLQPLLEPVRVGEVAPGEDPSSPSEPVLMIPQRPDLQPFKFVFFAADDGVTGRELWVADLPVDSGVCVPEETTLCLQNGRFRVSVQWQDFINDTEGVGRPIPATNESGHFWFFNGTNLELSVKVIDGREANGAFWFFYGALSDVAYQIEVEDLVTRVTKTYQNEQGNLCGQSDIDAFPAEDSSLSAPNSVFTDGEEAISTSSLLFAEEGSEIPPLANNSSLSSSSGTPDKANLCFPSDTVLCLHPGIIQVTVEWRDHDGNEGQGRVSSTLSNGQTGLFWFFDPENIELAVKVIDGTANNGFDWFFYGALSDVEYTIRALDMITGVERVYRNAPGNLCGQGDTEAFPGHG